MAKQYKNLILEQSKCQVVHSDLFAEGFDEVFDFQCFARFSSLQNLHHTLFNIDELLFL
jgi:hypothetical protein